MSLSKPLSRRTVIFSGKRPKSQERGRIPTDPSTSGTWSTSGNDEMGTIRCLIFIAGQIAARSAFRRKGPICARPLEWGPLLPTLRRAASPRRAPHFLVFPLLRKHIRDRVKCTVVSETDPESFFRDFKMPKIE